MYFITGASKGIGRFLFDELLAEGNLVEGCSSSRLTEEQSHACLSQVDVTNSEDFYSWINKKHIVNEKITLINCAGINYSALAHKADLSSWKKVIDVNLMGTFNAIHFALPKMRAQEFGRIINFSSVVAQKPVAGTSAYAASKAALWGLTKSLAIENAKKNITVNTINLGYFDIGMINEVPTNIQDVVKSGIPTGNFGEPEDILKTVKYLVETGYINGSTIDLNGGLI
jgi:NAD(P)-dependent dehydrogenase (short-subunit alcohol dehydrogenase family)